MICTTLCLNTLAFTIINCDHVLITVLIYQKHSLRERTSEHFNSNVLVDYIPTRLMIHLLQLCTLQELAAGQIGILQCIDKHSSMTQSFIKCWWYAFVNLNAYLF